MGTNVCAFSGTIVTKPSVITDDGDVSLSFTLLVDGVEYDRETRSYDETATMAECVVPCSSRRLAVLRRLLHVGTHVCVSCRMATSVGSIGGVTYPKPVFVIRQLDIGSQPSSVSDETWMERERRD